MEFKFETIDKQFELLLPALKTKEIQLRRNDYLGLSVEDIWDYLKEEIWKNKDSLHINEMVSDILSADNDAINSYKEL